MTKDIIMGDNNFNSNIGKASTNIEPYVLTEVVNEELIYVGTSNMGNIPDFKCWKIKKIWKDGDIWYMGFPNGDQSFSFIWDERKNYGNYK